MFFYASTVRRILDEENTSYLQEVTQQEAAIIDTQVQGDISTLRRSPPYLETIIRPACLPAGRWISWQDLQVQNGFKRMGIIYPDGTALTTDGGTYNFSDRGYFKKALAEISNISDTFADIVDGENINVYAVPVYSGNGAQVECVLFATISTAVFEDKISVSTFGGRGYSYVVDQAGNKIAASHHEDSITFDNILNLHGSTVEDPNGEFPAMQKNMAKGKSGVIATSNTANLLYQLCSDRRKFLVCRFRRAASVATAKALPNYPHRLDDRHHRMHGYRFLVYIVLSQNKSRRNLERIAYEDELTGSLSWMKFREEVKISCASIPAFLRND